MNIDLANQLFCSNARGFAKFGLQVYVRNGRAIFPRLEQPQKQVFVVISLRSPTQFYRVFDLPDLPAEERQWIWIDFETACGTLAKAVFQARDEYTQWLAGRGA